MITVRTRWMPPGILSALCLSFALAAPASAQLEKVQANPNPTETKMFGDLA